jgi:ribose-phosphate pyrophosphokinase
MITLNGKLVTPTRFPDGTCQVWKLNLPDTAMVRYTYEGDAELFVLFQLLDLLREENLPIQLYVDYFPYARQDKNIANDACFGLLTLLSILNDRVDIIYTVDVHNPEPFEGYSFTLVNQLPDVDQIASKHGADIVVFPDAGAAKRYSTTKPSYFASKVRDQETGAITGMTVPELPVNSTILVVDDIADGAYTHIKLAELFQEYSPKDIILYVSHGIFSKGTEIVHKAGYSKILDKNGLFSESPFSI